MAEQHTPQARRDQPEAPTPAQTAGERGSAGTVKGTLPEAADVDAGGLAAVCADAEDFFTSRMRGSWAPGYLAQRGFGGAVQREWAAGYAPAGWTTLTDHLRGRGHSDDAIEGAGLAVRTSRGTLVDLFRDRVMLPILAPHGGTVAFIGRAAPGADGDRHPKYLNTPSTSLYRKGEVLFGLPQAVRRIASGALPVIAEGPLDAIAVSIADPERFAGLAPCGTALTREQTTALACAANIADTGVLVVLDGDAAGRRGMVAAYRTLSTVTDHTYGVLLPPGSDPAEILRTAGPAALTAKVTSSLGPLADIVTDTFVDQRCAQLADVRSYDSYDGPDWVTTWLGRNQLMYEATQRIVAMPPAHWERQLDRLAARFHLPHERVFTAFLDAHNTAEDAVEAPKPIARRTDNQRAPGTATAATAATTAAVAFPDAPSHRMAATPPAVPPAIPPAMPPATATGAGLGDGIASRPAER